MHRFTAVAVCCFFAVAGLSFAGVEPEFPYKALVSSDQLYVRSGPGQEYYPTGRLRRGQEVEVFRHEPTGWCAIRPPEGSFTWILGRSLKLSQDGLAVVAEEGASARVGSRFSDIRDVEQVRLHKGEVVEVLETPHAADHEAATAGRATRTTARGSKSLRRRASSVGCRPVPRTGAPGTGASPGRRAGSSSGAPADSHPRRPIRRRRRLPRARIPAGAGQGFGGCGRRAATCRLARPRTLSTAEFQDELDRIELELSVMVIEEPTVWSFDLLRDQTNELLDQAATAEERGRTRQIANQIARFEDIKRRQEAVLAMREQSAGTAVSWRGCCRRDSEPEKARPQFETDGRFDGVGRLAKCLRRSPAPALCADERGGRSALLRNGGAGVNLRNYLGREVGVVGSRGYMPQQHAAHIVARHIAPLDGQNLLR